MDLDSQGHVPYCPEPDDDDGSHDDDDDSAAVEDREFVLRVVMPACAAASLPVRDQARRLRIAQ